MIRVRRFISFHLPVILYSAAVIALSSIPNLNPPPFRFLATDKLIHFVEYGVFALVVFRSFSNIGLVSRVNRATIVSALFIGVFAIFDEYYQRFIPGRSFDIYDILTDVCGAFLVLSLLWIRSRRKRNSTV